MDFNQDSTQPKSELRDYLILLLQNKLIVFSIFLVCLIVGIIYAYTAIDIYTTEGSIKISLTKTNLLSGPLLPEFQEFGTDRYIANEIEILKSYTLREIAAKSITDSFNNADKKYFFSKIYKDPKKPDEGILQQDNIIKMLESVVSIDQKRGLDIVILKGESPSAYEAALFVNCYIDAYYKFNLRANREQLTLARDFLEEQRKEKYDKLNRSEDALQKYLESGNIASLDEQARTLVDQLAQFEAQMNAAEIEAKSKQIALEDFQKKIAKQDERLAQYIKNLAAEPYIKVLQESIAKSEVQKDVLIASSLRPNPTDDPDVQRYINSIKELQKKLDLQLNQLEANLTAYTPEQLRQLSIEALKQEIELKSAQSRAVQLKSVVRSYEAKFNKLPKQIIEIAKLERDKRSEEKLYVLIEEKYQEALIAEQSKPGNVQVIDAARIPLMPSKPNRTMILIISIILGLGFAGGFIFIKKYFDVTIHTPEDIQNKGASVISWIPKATDFIDDFNERHEIVLDEGHDSIISESFLSAKMRLQYSKIFDHQLKSILITSPAPRDGKSFVCCNLAATFAITNSRTLVLDLDLRRPRVHNVLKVERLPGFTDYLFGKSTFDEIIKPTSIKNLSVITAGTIAPNPAEIVSSKQLEEFINKIEGEFEYILVDSPPIIPVSDAGILSRLCDATLLVVSTNQTRIDMMERAIETLKSVEGHFAGVLMNNFSTSNGYGYYYKYKYYHYYSKHKKGKGSGIRRAVS